MIKYKEPEPGKVLQLGPSCLQRCYFDVVWLLITPQLSLVAHAWCVEVSPIPRVESPATYLHLTKSCALTMATGEVADLRRSSSVMPRSLSSSLQSNSSSTEVFKSQTLSLLLSSVIQSAGKPLWKSMHCRAVGGETLSATLLLSQQYETSFIRLPRK